MNRADMLKRLKAGEDALELSIEKWQDIADGKGRNYDSSNCALCHVSINDFCNDCPVAKQTGKPFCHGSPYHDYDAATSTQQRKIAAREEVEFLKSLRKGAKKQ